MSGRTVACVLAAGLSKRFGGDKLLHPYNGKPLAAHIADAVAELPFAARLAVCPADNAMRQEIFFDRGFEILVNPDPTRGLSSSLAFAARRAVQIDADILVVCLADMPHVSPAHLMNLITALDGIGIVASTAGSTKTPPAAFSRETIPLLLGLTGDHGARELLVTAKTILLPAERLADFDTQDDLEAASRSQAHTKT